MNNIEKKLELNITSFIKKWELETVSVFFLELAKPVSFLGSQMMLVFSPFLGFFLSQEDISSYAEFFSRRSNVEKLIQNIENDFVK